jgi:hypothetical protein
VQCEECGNKPSFIMVSSRSRRIWLFDGVFSVKNEEEFDPDHVLRNSNRMLVLAISHACRWPYTGCESVDRARS